MTLRAAFQMDPIENLVIRGDSSFALMLEAQRRGHELLYYLPGDLENQIQAFVDHYNHRRYHESLGNLTPADVYFRRDTAIIKRREKIKKRTFEKRRLDHQSQAA